MILDAIKLKPFAFAWGVLLVWGGGVIDVGAQDIPKFSITAFKVEGNSLLETGEVNAAITPFIGPNRDFGDIQRALEALEEKYKQRGYSTVSVLLPEQVLTEGVVVLKVSEGRLSDFKIIGQLNFDEDNIRASLPTLKLGDPPQVDMISANLRIANENPAKKVVLQLKPGERDEDIEAHLKVSDERPWKVGATLENTGTAETGKRRLGMLFQHANLWNRDHVFTYQYQTSPDKPEDVRVQALSYRMPLYGLGDAIDLYATKSNVNSGTLTAGPVDLAISGSGSVFGGRYTLNLKRQGDFEQQMVFGLDHKAFQNNIGAGGLQLGNDITVHPFSVQYNGRWQSAGSELAVFGNVAHNLAGGTHGTQADFDKARLGAPKDFTVVRGGLTASHLYQNNWQIRFTGSAQWAGRPLIPGEQFGIGGAGSVRGFQEREIANDRGFQTTLELYTPELCQPLGGEHRCKTLVFIDSGAVYRVDALSGEQAREHIASTGLGLHYTWNKHVAYQMDYGHVLEGGGSQGRGDWRVHVSLGVYF